MNSIPQTIPEPIRWEYDTNLERNKVDTSLDKENVKDEKEGDTSVPYGWEDTKNWSWR